MNAAELFPRWFPSSEPACSPGCVYFRLGKSDKVRLDKYFGECSTLPLTERVEFKTALQRGDRVQVPKLVRWKYKLESTQTLKVAVLATGVIGGWETFYGRMDKSGRITVPKIIQNEMLRTAPNLRILIGAVVHVRLEPV